MHIILIMLSQKLTYYSLNSNVTLIHIYIFNYNIIYVKCIVQMNNLTLSGIAILLEIILMNMLDNRYSILYLAN